MRKKKLLLIILPLLLIAVWLFRFYRVNANFDGVETRYYKTGEKVPYGTDYIHISDEDLRGYSITVHGASIYTLDEYLELHDIEMDTGGLPDEVVYRPEFIYAVDVTFENEGNTKTEVGLNMYSTLLISANLRLMVNQNVWTPLYPHLEGSLMFKLYPDSSQDLQLPYAIETEWEANVIDRAELESRTFHLNITEYPTRKLIEVEKYD